MCHKLFFIFLPYRLLPGKLHLATTSLVDLPYSSSCKALYFSQSNLEEFSLCSYRKIEFCDVVKLDKTQQKQNRTSSISKN